jgi:hypothetical protein
MGLTWEADADEWTMAIDGPPTRERLAAAVEAAMAKTHAPPN